jgi:hypothetical protein
VWLCAKNKPESMDSARFSSIRRKLLLPHMFMSPVWHFPLERFDIENVEPLSENAIETVICRQSTPLRQACHLPYFDTNGNICLQKIPGWDIQYFMV